MNDVAVDWRQWGPHWESALNGFGVDVTALPVWVKQALTEDFPLEMNDPDLWDEFTVPHLQSLAEALLTAGFRRPEPTQVR